MKLVLLAFLLISLVSGVYFSIPKLSSSIFSTQLNSNLSVNLCTDTDGGVDVFYTGKVSGPALRGNATYFVSNRVDTCLNQNTSVSICLQNCNVSEQYCNDKHWAQSVQMCPREKNSCFQGSCVKLFNGDGNYLVSKNDVLKSTSGIYVKIIDLKEEFRGYRVSLDFYTNSDKLNLYPIDFSFDGTTAYNYNSFNAINITYGRLITQNGVKLVNITIQSLHNTQITNCHDLRELCIQNSNLNQRCNFYCIDKATRGEVQFSKNEITLITPVELQEIGPTILRQTEKCATQVKRATGVNPILEKLVIRFYLSEINRPITTDTSGVLWPVYPWFELTEEQKQENLQRLVQTFDFENCSEHELAHELVHFYAMKIALKNIFSESIAEYVSTQVANNTYTLQCLSNGWKYQELQNTGSEKQSQCYYSCFQTCKVQLNVSYLGAGDSIQVNPRVSLTINSIALNSTRYNASFTVNLTQNGQIAKENLTIGSIKAVSDYVFLFRQLAEDSSVQVYTFQNSRNDSFCLNNCNAACAIQGQNDLVAYSNLDGYLSSDQPFMLTWENFYNTGNCMFRELESIRPNITKTLLRRGLVSRNELTRYCIGREINSLVRRAARLREKYGYGDACSVSQFSYINSNQWP